VVGQLGVDLVIKQADPASGFLDLSGSSVQMQAATAKAAANDEAGAAADPHHAHRGAPEIAPAGAQVGRSGRLSPVSGVVKLEGSVANIAFLNSFLPADQGLAFSGDARMNAELRLARRTGRTRQPSDRRVGASGQPLSRFRGQRQAACLKAAIQGDAGAPEGKVEGFLKTFGLRRLRRQEALCQRA
jgi:hypothetical protein